jgi:hypothetical protein
MAELAKLFGFSEESIRRWAKIVDFRSSSESMTWTNTPVKL